MDKLRYYAKLQKYMLEIKKAIAKHSEIGKDLNNRSAHGFAS